MSSRKRPYQGNDDEQLPTRRPRLDSHSTASGQTSVVPTRTARIDWNRYLADILRVESIPTVSSILGADTSPLSEAFGEFDTLITNIEPLVMEVFYATRERELWDSYNELNEEIIQYQRRFRNDRTTPSLQPLNDAYNEFSTLLLRAYGRRDGSQAMPSSHSVANRQPSGRLTVGSGRDRSQAMPSSHSVANRQPSGRLTVGSGLRILTLPFPRDLLHESYDEFHSALHRAAIGRPTVFPSELSGGDEFGRLLFQLEPIIGNVPDLPLQTSYGRLLTKMSPDHGVPFHISQIQGAFDAFAKEFDRVTSGPTPLIREWQQRPHTGNLGSTSTTVPTWLNYRDSLRRAFDTFYDELDDAANVYGIVELTGLPSDAHLAFTNLLHLLKPIVRNVVDGSLEDHFNELLTEGITAGRYSPHDLRYAFEEFFKLFEKITIDNLTEIDWTPYVEDVLRVGFSPTVSLPLGPTTSHSSPEYLAFAEFKQLIKKFKPLIEKVSSLATDI